MTRSSPFQEGYPELSIIVPVYNERESLIRLYSQIKEEILKIRVKTEIIFVDDGSSDGSYEILRALAASDEMIGFDRFDSNLGQHKALETGFRQAKGELIITMDGDLQNDASDIPVLLGKLKEGYDVVCGWRFFRRDSLPKVLKSRIGNYLQRSITKVPLHDMSCTMRGYRKKIISGLRLESRHEVGLIPYILSRYTDRITEVRIKHNKRPAGKSKYGFFSTVFGVSKAYLRLMHIPQTSAS